MDDDVRMFGETLGRRLLARDWSGAHELLAPWLQQTTSAEGVRAFFEDEYMLTLKDNGIEELHYPQHPDPSVGGNGFTKATELRQPIDWMNGKVRPVAPEVTDDNVRYWMCLKLECSDEQMDALGFDCFCEAWLAVVQTPAGLRVGYWSQGAY